MDSVKEKFYKWMKKNCVQSPSQGWFGIGCGGKCCDMWYYSEEATSLLESTRTDPLPKVNIAFPTNNEENNEECENEKKKLTETIPDVSSSSSSSDSSTSTSSSSSVSTESKQENINTVITFDENAQMTFDCEEEETEDKMISLHTSTNSKPDVNLFSDEPSRLKRENSNLLVNVTEVPLNKKAKDEDCVSSISDPNNIQKDVNEDDHGGVVDCNVDDDDDDDDDSILLKNMRLPICRKKKVVGETAFFINPGRTKSICIGYDSQNKFLPCIVITTSKQHIKLPYKDSILLLRFSKDIDRAVRSGQTVTFSLDTTGTCVSIQRQQHICYVNIMLDSKVRVTLSFKDWTYFVTHKECFKYVLDDYFSKSSEVASLAVNVIGQSIFKNVKPIPSTWRINVQQLCYEMFVQ